MLKITSTAAIKLIEKIKSAASGIGVRLSVKKTGCSGFTYNIEYVKEPPPSHVILPIENSDYNIFIDPEDQYYFSHATLDYIKNNLEEKFIFFNPIEKNRCGCGKSFQI